MSQHQIDSIEQVDAWKHRKDGEAALALLRGIDELFVAKGKTVVRFDLQKERPDDATVLSRRPCC